MHRVLSAKHDELVVGQKKYTLKDRNRIIVVGAGKACASMAKAIEEIIPDKISKGFINIKHGHDVGLKKIVVNEAAHPVPDESAMQGAARIYELARQCDSSDMLIVLLSGGGSSLLTLPEDSISLADKQNMTECFLRSGASIQEINIVRKHISKIKGGKLAQAAKPAHVLSLILSDVIGDDLGSIASGPTVADGSTFSDAFSIIDKYNLLDKLPESIITHLKKGIKGKIPETPKPGDPLFSYVTNVIVGNIHIAIEAAKAKAQNLGYETKILSIPMQGDTEYEAYQHALKMKEMIQLFSGHKKPLCIISGGETTLKVKGNGKGGRNMHFALAVLEHVRDMHDFVLLSFGTDGFDGKTDAAGAVCDSRSYSRATAAELNPVSYLEAYDSYNFFYPLNDLFISGPTQTNVMDLNITLLYHCTLVH